MIYQIPLQKVPSQSVACVLSDQDCVINIRSLGDDLYFSLSVYGKVICEGVRIVDRSPLVQMPYKNFKGELYMIDRQGEEKPQYTGLNNRWVLLYLEQ